MEKEESIRGIKKTHMRKQNENTRKTFEVGEKGTRRIFLWEGENFPWLEISLGKLLL